MMSFSILKQTVGDLFTLRIPTALSTTLKIEIDVNISFSSVPHSRVYHGISFNDLRMEIRKYRTPNIHSRCQLH